ncbi:hypothetical protein CLUG_05080 [Clavispora lusitaniae ATCC 42720]|uniref:Rho-GAP domain-containing protein n=1 Tax=Clavispora lusitaniae (strain ATCC 42720) TaxID=306902 RepID=C4YAE2_CLAL4|nr:uncharacterized protein CLUG_05080 [Clavispora lusitaniae ATCC 42720]EEQ40952.1 hypothetical protein CLUG_05080 [Clavispora lusitaniae ATCC 42720]
MSTPASPSNRNSLLGWVKNLKRQALTSSDSVNDVSDSEPAEPRSPPRSSLSTDPSAAELLRPILNHKSRSTNNVHRMRSNSATTPCVSADSLHLRQHRDSFLQSNSLVDESSKYFGVPLEAAIEQASVKISIMAPDASSNMPHYGRIPIVVAKCGVFLKKNGLAVEGIFRVGGSSKRIRELQIIFNTPPDFGRKLDWDGYNVHDAASVLRRYLNALPEPLVPLHLYEDFRDPLRSRPRIIKFMKYRAENPRPKKPTSEVAASSSTALAPSDAATGSATGSLADLLDSSSQVASQTTSVLLQAPPESQPGNQTAAMRASAPQEAEAAETRASTSSGDRKSRSYKKLARDVYSAIDDYKHLLDELPGLSKQLLFYILDLLSMVQNNSNENLMSSRNLAAIFQPSILSHPQHDMDPEEYALSQAVVEFLIQYAYKLLPNEEPQKVRPVEPEHPKRFHSQSLSSPNPDDLDMIGYRNLVKNARGLTVSDTEHDFASASSDDENLSESLPKQLPKPTNAPNLMGVITGESPPPIVVSPSHQ